LREDGFLFLGDDNVDFFSRGTFLLGTFRDGSSQFQPPGTDSFADLFNSDDSDNMFLTLDNRDVLFK
jgi:hypothetical protein